MTWNFGVKGRVNDEGYLQLLNSSFYFWDNVMYLGLTSRDHRHQKVYHLSYTVSKAEKKCSCSETCFETRWNDTLISQLLVDNFFLSATPFLQLLAPLAFLRNTNLTALFSLLSWDWGVISKSWFRFPKNLQYWNWQQSLLWTSLCMLCTVVNKE